MVTAEQVKDIITRTAALGRYLDIDKKLARIEADEEKNQDPAFWNNAKEAERADEAPAQRKTLGWTTSTRSKRRQ